MRLSRFFLPLLKQDPAEASIPSHRLMLRAGLVRQTSTGIYAWLPLGLRVLKKIASIVRQEQERAGALEVLMPILQSADLWRTSGRYDSYGEEMLHMQDRHGRDMVYGPTNEEVITQLMAGFIHSYRDLPQNLFHIQWKFRDEIRPRFGVMRSREFLMKDGYSFDVDVDQARFSYRKMFVSYLRTFQRLGVTALPVRADTGPIGGDMSHEFTILASTGESDVFCHADLLTLDASSCDYNDAQAVASLFESYTAFYAASDEQHDAREFLERVPEEKRVHSRGIEVGHVFFFGDRYARVFQCYVHDCEGRSLPVQMGSYGIGLSRLVGAVIEARHDDKGIVWPSSIAPFHVGLINLDRDNEEATVLCERLYRSVSEKGYDVLYDDTEARSGEKFARMDLIGLPYQVIVGPKSLQQGVFEVKDRAHGGTQTCSHNQLELLWDLLGESVGSLVS